MRRRTSWLGIWLAALVACGGSTGTLPEDADPGFPPEVRDPGISEDPGPGDPAGRDPASPEDDPGNGDPGGAADPGFDPGSRDPGEADPDGGSTADGTGADPGREVEVPEDSGSWPPDPGTDPGPGPGGFLVPPVVTCPPPADACGLPAPVPGAPLEATYRKDFYLLDSEYNEYTDYPVQGGRFHVAGIAAVSGVVQEVRLDGVPVEELLVKPKMEWYHVWPKRLQAGEPVWFAFHSRDPAWDRATEATLVIRTERGEAVNGTFPVARTPVPLTYVTTTADRSAFVIHARNDDRQARTLVSLEVNGREVLGTGVACVPKVTIPPQTAVMWTVPSCGPVDPGTAWTVVARFDEGAPSVGVGRVLKPFFPIETWPNTSDCPVPTGNRANWEKHYLAGFDTYFLYPSGGGDREGCNAFDTWTLANEVLPVQGNQFLVIDAGFSGTPLTDTRAVVGFLTGDESDGEVWNDQDIPNAAGKAAKARALWDRYPDVAVYNGGKTNGNVGTFAGMTDIQGMDFYNAACAPHITAWGRHPPIDGPYDYLRNARNNHMPWPTWLYAQGLAPMWNFQPDATEATHAAMSAMAAGAKGLMWFQTNMKAAGENPATWQAIARANLTFRAVRAFLREGDVTGAATADKAVLVEAIRAREAIVAVVLNLDVESAPTDLACATSGIGVKPHWKLRNVQPTLSVTIPEDFGVREVFEVRDGAVAAMNYPIAVQGRTLRFGPVPLANAEPARVFVLAGAEGVREAVAAAGARPTLP